jgi:uncharacterized membrane protein
MEGPIKQEVQEGSTFAPPRRLLLTLAIIITAAWLSSTPGGLLGKADAVGYAVCHRIDLRSFHLGERTLPLCSRCTGMYLGSLITLLAFVTLRRRAGALPSRPVQYALMGFAALWALDGINSTLTLITSVSPLYPPQNWFRLVTGTLFGISLATLIYPVFIQSAWRDWDEAPIIPSGRWLAGLLGVLALVTLGVLSENPLILYPLAILSSMGVVVLLSMAYSVLTLIPLKLQNQANALRQLWLPLLMGFTLALVQIAAIDLLRYVLTGTWDGFHL